MSPSPNKPHPPRKIDTASIIKNTRWMIRRDLAEVMVIENQSFEYPRTEDEIISILQCRNTIGMVTEIDDKIVGFMIYELFRTNIQLNSIAVHEDWRRCGIGHAMIEKLKRKVRDNKKRNRLTLDIRERNLPGQLFFREQGFKATEVLSRFWDDGDGMFEDAYWLEWNSKDGNSAPYKPRRGCVLDGPPREPGSWKGKNRINQYLAGG